VKRKFNHREQREITERKKEKKKFLTPKQPKISWHSWKEILMILGVKYLCVLM
jgi:hypothetical protein